MTPQEKSRELFPGLFDEVATNDCYCLKNAKDLQVIFDLGANIGIFSRFAHERFPNARIVALEPYDRNLATFEDLTPLNENPWLERVHGALGNGPVFGLKNPINGAHQSYVCPNPGHTLNELERHAGREWSKIPIFSLQELVLNRSRPSDRIFIKLDCEGGEACLWQDRNSMEVLARAEYVSMELHYPAWDEESRKRLEAATWMALGRMRRTHDCEFSRDMFWARKRK